MRNRTGYAASHKTPRCVQKGEELMINENEKLSIHWCIWCIESERPQNSSRTLYGVEESRVKYFCQGHDEKVLKTIFITKHSEQLIL